eukprot:4701281-Prymnesium_polylepis.1
MASTSPSPTRLAKCSRAATCRRASRCWPSPRRHWWRLSRRRRCKRARRAQPLPLTPCPLLLTPYPEIFQLNRTPSTLKWQGSTLTPTLTPHPSTLNP